MDNLNPGNFGELVHEQVPQKVFGGQEQFPSSLKVFWVKGIGTMFLKTFAFWGTGEHYT